MGLHAPPRGDLWVVGRLLVPGQAVLDHVAAHQARILQVLEGAADLLLGQTRVLAHRDLVAVPVRARGQVVQQQHPQPRE